MKFLYPLLAIALTGTGVSEIRNAITKEGLLAKKAALAAQGQGGLVKPTSEEVEVRESTGDSVMESSTYLIGALGYTLIPNGSAHQAGKLFSYSKTAPEDRPYMQWDRFARSHRSGLRVLSVPSSLLKPGADTQEMVKTIASLQSVGVTPVTVFNSQPVRITKTPQPVTSTNS